MPGCCPISSPAISPQAANSSGDVLTPILGVPSKNIAKVWPHIEGLIKAGIAEGEEDASDEYLIRLECAQAQMFVTEKLDAVMITEIGIEPTEKILNVIIVAGKIPADFPEIEQAVVGWGRSEHCDCIEIRRFRHGWKRRLAKYGYSERAGYLRKEL